MADEVKPGDFVIGDDGNIVGIATRPAKAGELVEVQLDGSALVPASSYANARQAGLLNRYRDDPQFKSIVDSFVNWVHEAQPPFTEADLHAALECAVLILPNQVESIFNVEQFTIELAGGLREGRCESCEHWSRYKPEDASTYRPNANGVIGMGLCLESGGDSAAGDRCAKWTADTDVDTGQKCGNCEHFAPEPEPAKPNAPQAGNCRTRPHPYITNDRHDASRCPMFAAKLAPVDRECGTCDHWNSKDRICGRPHQSGHRGACLFSDGGGCTEWMRTSDAIVRYRESITYGAPRTPKSSVEVTFQTVPMCGTCEHWNQNEHRCWAPPGVRHFGTFGFNDRANCRDWIEADDFTLQLRREVEALRGSDD